MTVEISFQLDTSTGLKTVKVVSPFQDRGKTRDQISQRLDETAKSPKSVMPIRDVESGDYVFVNTMKLANIVIEEKNEEEKE